MSAPAAAGKTVLVFDTSAVLAWLLQEAGRWKRIDNLLKHPDVEAVLPSAAVAEVLYGAPMRGNTATREELLVSMAAHLRVESVTAEDGAWAGDRILESHRNPVVWPPAKNRKNSTLALGDGLVLAVAHRLGAPAVTFDAAWAKFPTMQFQLFNPYDVPNT
ncbi:PIN domain-containing protein [Pilimelia columellifera]|uniref:PIN domain-containing protein n=1 Tax=Pilimelia columellifera subsp. columellifera TaxID=706583 RepID=A0ABN3NPL4_9ACTN